MDKKIKQISNEIQKGKLLEENIPQLFNHMANHYQVLAKVRLALHYFTFYETYYDDENTWSWTTETYFQKVNQIIRDHVLQSQNGIEREKAIEEIDLIRRDITNRMNALTIYTDIYQNYEYVLNRIEYRFKEITEQVDETEFAKEILRYIFDTEDNLIINEKIKEMIGQLPIRITKQKYFEILKESLNVYLGSEGSSLDTFLYMLRTSAMLYPIEGMDKLYPNLWEMKEKLSKLEYKELTKEDYDKAVSMLQVATITLETESTVYFGLQEIINEVYSLILCVPYTGMVESVQENAEKAANSIIRNINDIFMSGEKKEIPEAMFRQFADLEGIQEEMAYEIDLLENAFYEVGKNHSSFTESLMLGQLYQVLKRAQGLLSDSLFIEFEDQKHEEVVDEKRIEKEAAALESELSNIFTSCDRAIGRAVIANTINKVPVFFQDHKEVMDYVRYSLERCSDPYEKAACFEIITEMMKE